MAVFQLGPIIRNRRMELGFSQEDLADGICSVPTLSRIENGERMPTKNHFEMLMQRLGYSAMSPDYFTDKRDFIVYELKFKIRQAFVARDLQTVETLLKNYNEIYDHDSAIEQQFSILYNTLLKVPYLDADVQLEMFESALRLTCPGYNCNRIPYMLSYEEIILLNNIATCYNSSETRHHAISILQSLKTYYDNHVINSEEALRTQPMVLYNLSKLLGMAGNYDECIEICDFAVRLAKKTSRCTFLGKILYNRAWALMQRNHDGDYVSAMQSASQARVFFQLMDDASNLCAIDKLIQNIQMMHDESHPFNSTHAQNRDHKE